MSYLKAQDVAKRLGIKTSTLARWRSDGKGPAGYFAISDTCIVYPEDEVEKFIERRRSESPGVRERARAHMLEVSSR